MTTTLFSATTLLFAHAKTEASDTSQAGQLVFSPSYGWIIAIIAILVLLAAMFLKLCLYVGNLDQVMKLFA